MLGHHESRKIVLCGEVEHEVFGKPMQTGDYRALDDNKETDPSSSLSSEDDDDDGGVAVGNSGIPMSPTGPQQNTANDMTPQQLGRLRAANREKVRQAARRGAVFGFTVKAGGAEDNAERRSLLDIAMPLQRKVEAVQGGRIVEASFAKGEWGVRWKDRQT